MIVHGFREHRLEEAAVAEVLGTFEQAVLLALARPKTPLGKEGYGRAVLKEVQLRLDREVSAGAVYATLDRLEKKGLISSQVRAMSGSPAALAAAAREQ